MTNRKFFLILILFLALILRVWGISSYPVGFTQDEASLGYDAYSLLHTSKDQWGENWPLVFRSFGDFKLPLYSYLAIPSVAVFGLNEFSVRLPNALMGTLAVLVIYLMVGELFRYRNKSLFTNHQIELLSVTAAFLLAISPWHISLSRGAFEANLTTLFIPLGVWAFLRGIEKPKWMILAAVSFGLNLFSYHAARLFTPVVVVLLLMFFQKGAGLSLINRIKFFLNRYKVFSFIFLIFFSITVLTVIFGGAGKRGADILISNPTDKWVAVSDRRYEAVLLGLPDQIARIYSNKVTYVVNLFLKNYFSYLSPYFLFFQGAGEWSYGMIPGRGVMYTFELIFAILALISFIRKKDFYPLGFIFLWILLSPLAPAITKGPGYAANRIAVMIPAIVTFSAYGFVVLSDYLKEKLSKKMFRLIILGVIGPVFLFSFLAFAEDYLFHAPFKAAEAMHYGMKDAVFYVGSVERKFDEIRFSRSFSVPHISVAFYNQWDPIDYQNASKDWLVYQEKGFSYLDQMEGYRLGEYTFGSLDISASRGKRGILLVGKPAEFPIDVVAEKIIYFPNGTPAVKIVKGDSL